MVGDNPVRDGGAAACGPASPTRARCPRQSRPGMSPWPVLPSISSTARALRSPADHRVRCHVRQGGRRQVRCAGRRRRLPGRVRLGHERPGFRVLPRHTRREVRHLRQAGQGRPPRGRCQYHQRARETTSSPATRTAIWSGASCPAATTTPTSPPTSTASPGSHTPSRTTTATPYRSSSVRSMNGGGYGGTDERLHAYLSGRQPRRHPRVRQLRRHRRLPTVAENCEAAITSAPVRRALGTALLSHGKPPMRRSGRYPASAPEWCTCPGGLGGQEGVDLARVTSRQVRRPDHRQ